MSTIAISLGFVTRATDTTTTGIGTASSSNKIEVNKLLQSADVSVLYCGDRVVSGSEVLNLTSGLFDAWGVPLVFASVSGIHVENTGTTSLIVGGGANPVFGTDQQTLKPAGTWVSTTAWTVSGTAKNITVSVSGGSSSSSSSSSGAAPVSEYKIIVYGN